MAMLAQNPRTLFVGQAVKYPGQAAYRTFDGVPDERRIEMPVAEDFQAGFCAGLSLVGYIPIAFYPRWDFLLLAANQLINHLDKMPLMQWAPKVIFRTSVGRKTPLDPGPQHSQDYTAQFRSALHTIKVVELYNASRIVSEYQNALSAEHSTIIVERMSLY